MTTMREHRVDLIVLEGMGRAVHTNLHAAFACDALKVAVLKNRWLANRLGGDMFSVMFKFEKSAQVAASWKTIWNLLAFCTLFLLDSGGVIPWHNL